MYHTINGIVSSNHIISVPYSTHNMMGEDNLPNKTTTPVYERSWHYFVDLCVGTIVLPKLLFLFSSFPELDIRVSMRKIDLALFIPGLTNLEFDLC